MNIWVGEGVEHVGEPKKFFFKFHGVICYSLLLTLAEIESFAPSLLSLSDFGSQSNKNFDN